MTLPLTLLVSCVHSAGLLVSVLPTEHSDRWRPEAVYRVWDQERYSSTNHSIQTSRDPHASPQAVGVELNNNIR